MVKARTFRKGVRQVPPTVSGDAVSAVQCAVYRKAAVREAVPATGATPGLNCQYYEEDAWQLSGYILDVLPPLRTGVVPQLFDLSAKGTNAGVYAFVYSGYLDIPENGVYSFHAPDEFVYPTFDCAYDLRVFVGAVEWYPATGWHNYGAWSVPLQKGRHAFRVVWVDQRKQGIYGGVEAEIWNGTRPKLMISGPGLAKQPIPAGMLFH
jgi:hypothetical protein